MHLLRGRGRVPRTLEKRVSVERCRERCVRPYRNEIITTTRFPKKTYDVQSRLCLWGEGGNIPATPLPPARTLNYAYPVIKAIFRHVYCRRMCVWERDFYTPSDNNYSGWKRREKEKGHEHACRGEGEEEKKIEERRSKKKGTWLLSRERELSNLNF